MTRLLTLLLATLFIAAPAAHAQCGEWDNRFGRPLGMSDQVFAMTRWDPDGSGPATAQLVAGGDFLDAAGERVDRIARWDSERWLPFADGLDSRVNVVTTWDPDGDGPLELQLVAGGSFTNAGGVVVNRVARWDGSAWHAFGSGMDGAVYALTSWDPDGPGPQRAELVAGGLFITAGGETVNRIARWDGSTWQPLGGGVSNIVYALTTWDPDGSGPQQSLLVAGGVFGSAGGVTVDRIALWDGTSWHPLGTGMSGGVFAVTTWDADGPATGPDQLVAGGTFTLAGGVTVNRVARWDGAQWQAFDAGVDGTVRALTVWDPDCVGPLGPQVVVGGDFIAASGILVNRIARWDGSQWLPLDSGVNGRVNGLATWDPDGPGPLSQLVATGGTFSSANQVFVGGIGQWNGKTWRPFGDGISNSVFDITSWDPDGIGPLEAQLIAGGSFNSAGGVVVNRIARWDGTQWYPLGGGTDGDVWSLLPWDADGTGPAPARLVASGTFYFAGGQLVNRVASWDGSSWQGFSVGIDIATNAIALAGWDPDGTGPQSEVLVVGGSFSRAGGISAASIARWDGNTWQAFGDGMNGSVRALISWDADGKGSHIPQLIAAGEFTTAGSAPANRIARWDGETWQPIGTGMNGPVYALTIWDSDGDGSTPALLVAGGDFTTAGGGAASRVACWDGLTWQPLTTGVNASVSALTTWDPDGDGPQPPQLVAGGQFTNVSGLPAGYMAMWSTLPPEITAQPIGNSFAPGADAQLTVAARNGQPTYQWRKAGINLSNGPTAGGSTITGATSPTLTITAAQPDDAGLYDCLITNSCGSTASDAVTLTVAPPSCPGDANGDNLIDGADLSVILENWNQPVPAGNSGDINNDGIVNGADLSILLATFGSSC